MQGQLIGREYSRANLCGKKKKQTKNKQRKKKYTFTRETRLIVLLGTFRHDILEDKGQPSWFQEYQIFVRAVGRVGGRRARKICLLPPAFHCYELKLAVPTVSARS